MSNLSPLGYLQAMGVDVYVRRHAVLDDVVGDTAGASNSLEQEARLPLSSQPASSQPPSSQMAASVSNEITRQTAEDDAPSSTQSTHLNEAVADVVTSVVSPIAQPVDTDAESAEMVGGELADIPSSSDEQNHDVLALGWQQLAERVSQCQACGLAASRTQTVFGIGNQQADVLVIGEAPGQEEDRQGEPFVGRAGQLLDAMLVATGMNRQQVYIANMLKCRPPNNRDPEPTEVQACNAYLQRQIQLLNPKVILVVGRIAAQALLNTEQTIGRLRGRVHTLAESQTPVVVTYHPAYLLRQPSQKEKSWQDLQQLMRLLG